MGAGDWMLEQKRLSLEGDARAELEQAKTEALDEARAEVARLRSALKAVVACHSWPSAIIIAGEAIAKGGAT